MVLFKRTIIVLALFHCGLCGAQPSDNTRAAVLQDQLEAAVDHWKLGLSTPSAAEQPPHSEVGGSPEQHGFQHRNKYKQSNSSQQKALFVMG